MGEKYLKVRTRFIRLRHMWRALLYAVMNCLVPGNSRNPIDFLTAYKLFKKKADLYGFLCLV
jgi:hypothetical protein